MAEEEQTIFTQADDTSKVAEATQAVEELKVAESAPAPAPAPAPASGKSDAWKTRALDATSKTKDGSLAEQWGHVHVGNATQFHTKAPKVQMFAAKGSKSLPIAEEAVAAWFNVLDEEDPMTFVMLKYNDKYTGLELASTGTGGLNDFKAALPDGVVTWGAFKCKAVDDRGNMVCKRSKFVFVQYMPDGASSMKKAKMGPHKGDVKACFHSTHVDMCVTSLDDLEPEALVLALQAATGAHKPNNYEFEEGVLVSADYYSGH